MFGPRFNHYALRPKRTALHAKAPPRRATQREFREHRLVLRSPEGGPDVESYRARAKIMLLLRLKQLYPEDTFIREAPLTLAFFDQWFELDELGPEVCFEEVVENLTPDLFDDVDVGPEAQKFKEMWLDRRPGPAGDLDVRYRVTIDGAVVGWVLDPLWQDGEVHGSWEPTTNREGKAFAQRCSQTEEHDVVVLVTSSALRGRLRFCGDENSKRTAVHLALTPSKDAAQQPDGA